MINYKIETVIANISKTNTTEKMLTLTSWNGNPAKLDLREWREIDGEKVPGKGITLNEAEAAALTDALNTRLHATSPSR